LRQYYTVETTEVASTTSSTTETLVEKVVKLSLPIKFAPLGGQYCVASDIVGVTLGGSLLLNSEANLYKAFSSNTLIGYALDGFPVYGTGTSLTDGCGGISVEGQYRYELSADRETIINCFSDRPSVF